MTAGDPDDGSARGRSPLAVSGPYLDRVRAATTRMSARHLPSDDVRAALELLHEHARIDPAVPTQSVRPAGAYAKGAIRKLMGWYVRFIAAQVSLLGGATARFGDAVADRLDRLEAENEEVRSRLARLEALADRGGATTP